MQQNDMLGCMVHPGQGFSFYFEWCKVEKTCSYQYSCVSATIIVQAKDLHSS